MFVLDFFLSRLAGFALAFLLACFFGILADALRPRWIVCGRIDMWLLVPGLILLHLLARNVLWTPGTVGTRFFAVRPRIVWIMERRMGSARIVALTIWLATRGAGAECVCLAWH